jgi:hypothetical protein
MAGKKIFENKTWLIAWANDRRVEIRVDKKTFPIPSHGVSDYFIYEKGKIVGNYPQGWMPDYIKNKIKAAFAMKGKK